MAKTSKSKKRAIEWVQFLMDHLSQMDRMNKRESAAVAKLLRAGCAATTNDGNPEWEADIISYPDLDTGEALLHLSNRAAWNADGERFSLEDIYKAYPSH